MQVVFAFLNAIGTALQEKMDDCWGPIHVLHQKSSKIKLSGFFFVVPDDIVLATVVLMMMLVWIQS